MKDYKNEFERLVREPALLARLSETVGNGADYPAAPQGLRVHWDTLCSHRGWKLQKNYYFRHYRILDEYGVIRAKGLESDMLPAIESIAPLQ